MSFRSLNEWCRLLSGLPLPQTDSDQTVSVPFDSNQEFEQRLLQVASGQPGTPYSPSCVVGSQLLQSISLPSMGCEFEVLLNEHQYANGVECAVEALRIVEQIENLLSVYRPQSQISKVNQFAAQRPVQVDAKTLELIQLGLDVHEWTLGAFDLTAGSLSEAWGFARRQGAMPTDEQIQKALHTSGSQWIRINATDNTISLQRAGVKLNSGGIGKGYALDFAARYLHSRGIENFLMHGGFSSIVARGTKNGASERSWNIALKHPWRSNETIDVLSLEDQALGTSGSGKQYFHFGGKRYSHLIDPRSGWPAEQMMSVTVVCASGAVADALATGLFILGPQAAMEFCEAHPEVAAILIFTDSKTNQQRIEYRNCHSLG